MFVQKQRYGNVSSGENSEEDVSEGDILQVKLVSFKSKNLFVLYCVFLFQKDTQYSHQTFSRMNQNGTFFHIKNLFFSI